MGVIIKKKSSSSLSWGGDDRFEPWAASFRSRFTYALDKDSESKLSRVPLSETLEQVRRMKVWVKDSACLEKNVLFACYQAAHTKRPEEYEAARARAERENLVLQLNAQKKFAEGLLGFVTRNQSKVTGCFQKAKGMTSKGRDVVIATPDEKSGMLAGLLAEYEYGLERDLNDQLAIGVDNLYQFGPFLFEKEVFHIEKREAPNVTELGLIFHLSYLFRYFTAKSEPQQSRDNTRDSGLLGDELRVKGEMLNEGGKPCHAQVASLVNAVIGKKYKPDDIKFRLKDLLAPPVRTSRKLAGRKKYIEFAGWEIEAPS